MGTGFQVNPISFKKAYIIANLTILCFGIVVSLGILFSNNWIKDIQYIPTLVNGITSSTSIMIAAAGFLITHFRSKESMSTNRSIIMICIMVIASLFVFMAYVSLTSDNFVDSLKLGMLGLLFSLLNFVSLAIKSIEKL